MHYGRWFAILVIFFYAFSIDAQQIGLAPPTPSTPSVLLQADNTILVSWSNVSAQYYELSANVNGAWQPSIRVENYTYNYATSPGNSYLFRVRACRGIYSNDPPTQPPLSALVSTTTATQTEFCSTWTTNSSSVSLPPIPGVPSSPNVTAVGTQVTLTWTAVANASYYMVTAGDVSGQVTEYRASANDTIITLKSGGSYILRVRACSTSGCSQSSGATTVTIVPSVVSNVNISVSGYTMTFSWGAVNGAYPYIVQQYQNGAWGSEIDVGGATSKQFTGSDGGYYKFRVKACNSGGCSTFSAEKTAGFIPKAPTTPQVSLSGLTVTVSWSAVSGNLSYRVQQYASGNWQTEIDVGTVTSKAFSGVAGSTYRYRVRSCNAAGCSTFSPEVPISLSPSVIGTAPSVSSSGTKMTVAWTLSSGAKNYKVQQYSSGAWQPELDVGLAISYVFNGTAGSTYQYRVRACNDGGCSAYSAASSVTLVPAIPATPNVTTSGTTMAVKWTAVAGATGYRVQQYASGAWQTEVDTGTALTKTFAGVAGATYQYRVRACNSAGCSAFSISSTLTLVPSVPATPVVAASGTAMTVSWAAVSEAISYRVQQYASGAWQTEIDTGTALTKSFAGTAGATYQYRVRACNAGGCSVYSAASSVTLVPAIPVAPNATSSGTTITVNWAAVTGTTSYRVQQYAAGVWQTEVDTGTNLTKSFTGTAGAAYQYRIRACNTAGCSAYSTTTSVTLIPTIPAAPSATASGTTITVNWAAVTGTTSYRVQQYADGVWQTEINAGTALTKSFVGKAGATYQYRTRACNVGGCSLFSNANTITLVPATPAIPSVQISGLNMKVTWLTGEGVSSYKIQQYTVGAWQAETDVGTLIEKTYLGVLGQTYQYRVRSCNSSGCSSYSAASATIKLTNRVIVYLHTDVIGSVIAETDESGKVIKEHIYKPFGEKK